MARFRKNDFFKWTQFLIKNLIKKLDKNILKKTEEAGKMRFPASSSYHSENSS